MSIIFPVLLKLWYYVFIPNAYSPNALLCDHFSGQDVSANTMGETGDINVTTVPV